jgi:hypothetical protein
MYRNDEFLPAKIVPTGWGWVLGAGFLHMRKCGKKFIKCLIFKDLPFSAIFPHPFRNLSANLTNSKNCVITTPTTRINSLIFNALPTSSKCLIFNGFKHFCSAGRVGQGWGVKQGIRWLGLVFGLMLSKDAKQGC